MSDEARIARLESLVRQLQGALGGLKVVRGVVTISGGTPSIAEGADFSLTDNGVGDITITFDPAFSGRPSVDVLPIASGAVVESGSSPASASQIRLVFFTTTTGASADPQGFHFIAIGPA